MNRGLYRKLAFNNIKKNKNTFFPFAFACIAMVAMFYMLRSVQLQVNDTIFAGARTMRQILGLGAAICGIFSVFVVFYTNSFLMKRRSKEFGLYSILGMEKKHIGKVVFWEIAIVGFSSIVIGLFSGVLLSKLMFMILLKLFRLDTGFSFMISGSAILITATLFMAVFLLVMLVNSFRVFRLKPIELMSGSRVGEQEPKAKWAMAIIGLVCLGIGYVMALTTENAVQAMGTFFIAVLFVIAGTYFLFVSGSIVLLKLLKKNKNFYYQKKHFITVSGMMYRMKQNAVGLSNICILSTAVLVVLSTTVSLYVGMDEMLENLYPREVQTEYFYEEGLANDEGSGHYDYSVLEPAVKKLGKKHNVQVKNIEKYYNYWDIGTLNGNSYSPEKTYISHKDLTIFDIMTIDGYNTRMGTEHKVEEGKVLLYDSENESFENDEIVIQGEAYSIAEKLSAVPKTVGTDESFRQVWVIVPDLETLKSIAFSIDSAWYKEVGEEFDHVNIYYNFNFDLNGKEKNKSAFCTELRDTLNDTGIAHLGQVNDLYSARQDFYGMYGSLFFIGLFIGALFLITTVMIIYYKQVSEGYDDRDRFHIMQKVGMSEKEVKGVINNQIVLVFLLPIIVAIVHICFAFNIIKQLLIMFNLTNVALFVGCTIGTIIVFFLVYGIVYKLTAKAYYRITQQ